MKSLTKYSIILIATLVLGQVNEAKAQAHSPHVSAIAPYVSPANAYVKPSHFTYMPDGQSYLTLSPDHRAILRFDTRTGEQIERFLDLDNTRETSLADIEGFTISDDASKVIVWRNRKAIYRRSFMAQYFVYEVRSRLLRPLSVKFDSQRSPIFSPNARMVAFVAEDNNIYIKKLDYNNEVAVTEDGSVGNIINGVSDWTYEEEFSTTCSMAWSPDNSTFCFVKYNESEVPTYNMPIYSSACHPNEQYSLYPGIYSYKYPVAGKTNSTVTIHSYDVDTRKIKDIALQDKTIEYIPNIHFAPTGISLIVPTLNREQNRLEIYSVNPKSTVVKSIYTENSTSWISPETYEKITYAADGMVILSSKSGFAHLYKYSYAGAEIKQLTTGEFDVTDYYGTDANGSLYYQSATPTPLDRTINRIDRKGVTTVVGEAKGWSSASFSPGMEYMNMSYSTSAKAPVYTICKPDGKLIRTLEDNAAYMAKYEGRIPTKEFFTFNSDGYELNGYIIKPTDFSSAKKYPVIMTQYSGPGSQTVVNRWAMDFDYYYALQGYVVIAVDGRGTGGRGRKFTDIVYKQLGHYETIDQINAAAYVASLPFVDPQRIGICGWSYGGYETLMCVTETNSPFAAAVAIAPVTDWRYYDTVYAERYMSTPQQNAEGYNASAPINRTHRLKCPLLMMYGTSDDNVHPANTLNFVSRLQSQGLLCDMFVFPAMNHSINGCNSRAVVYAKMLDYFDKALK